MGAKRITSASNPLIKELAELKARRGREASGSFLVEGAREATAAVAAPGHETLRLLHAPDLVREPALIEALIAAAGDVEVIEVSEGAFRKLSMRQHADGVALQLRLPDSGLTGLDLAAATLVLVIDGVEKPGNLGALLRSADAVGADAVVVTGHGTDAYNPNVVRASQGSLFALPLVRAEPVELAAALSAAGLTLVTTSPAAEVDYWDADLAAPVAIVLGAEDVGIGRELAAASDVGVRIPMRAPRPGAGPRADSLNVSVAGALLLFEALRQRSRR